MTLYDLVELYHRCNCPEPLTLHIEHDSVRFFAKYTAIKRVLDDAAADSSSEDDGREGHEGDYDEDIEIYEGEGEGEGEGEETGTTYHEPGGDEIELKEVAADVHPGSNVEQSHIEEVEHASEHDAGEHAGGFEGEQDEGDVPIEANGAEGVFQIKAFFRPPGFLTILFPLFFSQQIPLPAYRMTKIMPILVKLPRLKCSRTEVVSLLLFLFVFTTLTSVPRRDVQLPIQTRTLKTCMTSWKMGTSMVSAQLSNPARKRSEKMIPLLHKVMVCSIAL